MITKIAVQVFNILSSKFSQLNTNVTEVAGELAFTERLEWLYLIIILLIML